MWDTAFERSENRQESFTSPGNRPYPEPTNGRLYLLYVASRRFRTDWKHLKGVGKGSIASVQNMGPGLDL